MEERRKLQSETVILPERAELALDDPRAWWIVESGSLSQDDGLAGRPS